jgi:tetratricopeptide (TPR) repeat protein
MNQEEKEEDILERYNQIVDDAINMAGECLTKKPLVSELILKQLLKVDSENLEGLKLLGLCKQRLGEFEESIEIIKTVLELDPDNSDNWNNLGLSYGGLDQRDKAIECIKKACELKKDAFLYKNNLALQYRAKGDYEKAVRYLKEAIEGENNSQLWVNLAGVYFEQKMIDEAEKCCENSIRIDPNNAGAYVDLAFSYFHKGNFHKGFAAYEWRFLYYPQMRYYLNAYDMSKVWDGSQDLNGKRVLVYGEQGVGDIIQFARYANDLKKLGAHVIINCPSRIDSIIKKIEGVDETSNKDVVNIDDNDKFPDYDYQFSTMSFPYLLNKKEICGEPYIKIETDSFKEHMKEEYGSALKVGIVWAGSPIHPDDKKRSIHLKHFKNLSGIDNVKLFSLQMDTRPIQYGIRFCDASNENPTEIENFQKNDKIVDYNEDCEDMRVVDLTKMVQTYEDTAVILTGLDLVICCDTSVAHLAGAMGVPVWMAVSYNSDWRWNLEGDTTVWYDSMKIYRQSERGKWEDVFERIKKDLNEIVLQDK